MNYAELNNMLVDITARQDLVSENRVAIAGAVRKFHLADLFQADMAEVEINLALYPTSNFTWSIDTTSDIFTRFRKLYHASIVRVDRTFQSNGMPSLPPDYHEAPSLEIPIRSPSDLFTRDGERRSSYIYLAGTSLMLRLANTGSVVNLKYFKHPDIRRDNGTLEINSWIVDQMPEAIVTEAAGTIFKMIGKDEEFQRHQVMFAENLALLRQSAVMDNAG